MFCRPAPFSSRLRGRVIKDRVIPCIPNQAKVLVFIHDRNQIPFCVPVVTQEDDIFLFRQLRHDLPYHGSGKFQLGLFFLPHPVGKRHFDVQQREKTLNVRIENTVEGEITMKNGSPVTTKQDRRNHGLGLMNVKAIVEKYSRNYICKVEVGRYATDIFLIS